MKGALPVRGHALRAEGKVVESNGRWRGGVGCGLCECGAKSDELPTTAARQRWHREHKTEVINADLG